MKLFKTNNTNAVYYLSVTIRVIGLLTYFSYTEAHCKKYYIQYVTVKSV